MANSNEVDPSDGLNSARAVGTAVMSASQDAADLARNTAQRAADKLPDAVASVQTAASDAHRQLGDVPDDTLMIGISFSVGMAVALFLNGANRLLVLIALAPAAAMAATVFGRDRRAARKK